MKKLLVLLMFLASPAAAQKLSLNAISSYLNGLQTAKGAFTQINGDGSISTGTMYMKRPGRLRFEYAPPTKSLVMAGGGQVAVFEAKSDEPTRYPLAQTPLKIILERNVNLGQRNMVTSHKSDGTKTVVTAQDPRRPDLGSLQMVFTGNPIQLRQWIVDDNSGSVTTVILGDWREGVSVPNKLFNIQFEMGRWNP